MILNITKSNESHKLTDLKLLQQVHDDPQVLKSVKPNSASPHVELLLVQPHWSQTDGLLLLEQTLPDMSNE